MQELGSRLASNLMLRAVPMHIVWAPKKSAVLIKDSLHAELVSMLFREGTFQALDLDRHTWSLKALLLTVLRFRRGVKLSHQYLGHYARLVDCLAVVSFRNNGAGLGAFKAQKRSVTTVAFQNGIDNFESLAHPFISRSQAAGPDVAFGFDFENLKWLYSGLVHQPLILPTGSLRSNLVPLTSEISKDGPLIFISQWKPDRNPSFYQTELQLLPFLASWCADRQIGLLILGRSGCESKQERAFFEDIIAPEKFFFSPKSPTDWAGSYRQIDSAEIVVSVNSTLGVEALLRGKKTCFFTDITEPVPVLKTGREVRIFSRAVIGEPQGPFWINDGSITEFDRLLSRIHKLSEKNFTELVADADWLGTPDPGLFQTRKRLIELDPRLENVAQPLSQPVMIDSHHK